MKPIAKVLIIFEREYKYTKKPTSLYNVGFTASRKNSDATMQSDAYGESFRKSLQIIEKEENGGLAPEVLAKTIEKIVTARHPKLRYPVANLEQRLSILLHTVLPGNWFVDVLRGYYKV